MIVQITHIDTACCLIEMDGYKILTDPTLDKKGNYYHHGFGAVSKKTENPKINLHELDNVNLILLSHPQHKDNFDKKGKEFAKKAPLILSTKRVEKSFSNSKGMNPWDEHEILLPNRNKIRITATPAQHHPNWLPEFISGKVVGFVIEHEPSKTTIYITGDTIFFNGIAEVSERFKRIDYALIHVGSAEFRYLTGCGKFTMDAEGFVKTLKTVKPKVAIPIHNQGWTHFKENDKGIKKRLKKELISVQQRVKFLESGLKTQFS